MHGKHVTVLEESYNPVTGKHFYKAVLEIDGEIDEIKKVLIHYIAKYYILEDDEISPRFNSSCHYDNFDNALEIQ